MDGGNEQSCHNILFQSQSVCKRNTSIGEKAYGNEALNRSNIFRWYSRFGNGRELVDDERGGRPKSTRTEVNITAVAADLVKNDHRITSRMISESLTIPKTVVLQILKEDLGRRKFFLLHNNAPAHTAAFANF
jgi:hypothetical protein